MRKKTKRMMCRVYFLAFSKTNFFCLIYRAGNTKHLIQLRSHIWFIGTNVDQVQSKSWQ